MTRTTYAVTGMTCAHCERAVADEVGRLSGVDTVEVDLGAGTVTVSGHQPPDLAAVRAAVLEAGYELAEPAP